MNKEIYTFMAAAVSLGALTAASPVGAQQTVSAAAAQAAGTPQVVVNHQPVMFQGQPPLEQNGHLLVPLRGVLEKMGAYVDFDSATQTVVAFRGQTRITLPIGSQQAQVNGQPVSLDVPAQVVNGSTLVPLRFVAEALGAQVSFDINTNTVDIRMAPSEAIAPPPDPGVDAMRQDDDAAARRARHEADARRAADAQLRAEERQRALDAERQRLATQNAVVGTVVALYTDLSPARVVIHVPANSGGPEGDRTIPLVPDVPVMLQRPGAPRQGIPLTQLNEGDLISVLQNGDGNGTAINLIVPPSGPPRFRSKPWVPGVFRGEFYGIERKDDHLVLRMVDGRVIDVPHDVPITYHNHPVRPEDIRPGDVLSISVDATSHRGTRISVNGEL